MLFFRVGWPYRAPQRAPVRLACGPYVVRVLGAGRLALVFALRGSMRGSSAPSLMVLTTQASMACKLWVLRRLVLCAPCVPWHVARRHVLGLAAAPYPQHPGTATLPVPELFGVHHATVACQAQIKPQKASFVPRGTHTGNTAAVKSVGAWILPCAAMCMHRHLSGHEHTLPLELAESDRARVRL